MKLPLQILHPRLAILFVALLFTPAHGLSRTIGPPNDKKFQQASRICNGTDPSNFRFGTCGSLIDCALDNLDSGTGAAMQSGGSIVALVPTILALLGAPPLELVELALHSPHKALITSIFGIGLPTGLFRQLRTLQPYLSDKIIGEPRIRVIQKPVATTYAPVYVALRVCSDIIILALGGIMLWRNWVISSMVMITWRCEYSWLILCWPIACAAWLIIAMGTLFLFAKSINITYSEDVSGTSRTLLDLISLNYRLLKPIRPDYAIPITNERSSIQRLTGSSIRLHVLHPRSPVLDNANADSQSTADESHWDLRTADNSGPVVTVKITMYSAHGLRSWKVFEALIEALAVGIYLYATIVFTSTLFLSGQEAIIFICIMVLSMALIRILGILF